MKRKFLFLSILGGVFLLASCYQYVLFPFDPNTGSNGEDYIWDGSTSDLSWYAENPNASTYSLSTPEEFAGLAALVRGGNSLAGKTITLANDIDLGGHNWTTIGTGNRSEMEDEDNNTGSFQGIFDGDGHTINGLMITSNGNGADDDTPYGFFGTTNNATIKNVTFSDASINADTNSVGVIVGYAQNTSIENVIVTNSHITGAEGAGAIAGRVYLTQAGEYSIKENHSIGNEIETSSSYNAGGLIGCVYCKAASATLDFSDNTVDMRNRGYVNAYSYTAGGIVGTITLNLSTEGNTFSNNQIYINDLSKIKAEETNDDGEIYMGLMHANSSNMKFNTDKGNTVIFNGEATLLASPGTTHTMSGNNFLTGSINFYNSTTTPVENVFNPQS